MRKQKSPDRWQRTVTLLSRIAALFAAIAALAGSLRQLFGLWP